MVTLVFGVVCKAKKFEGFGLFTCTVLVKGPRALL